MCRYHPYPALSELALVLGLERPDVKRVAICVKGEQVAVHYLLLEFNGSWLAHMKHVNKFCYARIVYEAIDVTARHHYGASKEFKILLAPRPVFQQA